MHRRNEVTSVCISELRRLNCALDDDLSPHEFVEKYEEHFPVLMRVSIGYCGQNAIDFTFSSDEVYLITHVLMQERVLLKDTREQVLSFPVDHKLQFYTIIDGQKSEKPAKLLDIINSDKIALTSETVFLEPVDIPGRSIEFCVGPDKTVKLAMEVMELLEAYDERYIVGNSITHEILHFPPFIIPMWMPIHFNIATGIKNCPERDFKELLERLTIQCRDFKNSSAPGNKEIMLFQEDINDYEGPYDLIQPSNAEYRTLPHKRPSVKSEQPGDKPPDDDKPPEEQGPVPLPRQPIIARPPPETPSKEDKSKSKGILNRMFGKSPKKEQIDTEGYQIAHQHTDGLSYSASVVSTGLSSTSGSTRPNQYVHSGSVERNSNDSIDIPYTRAKKTIEFPAPPIKHAEEEKESSDDECYEYVAPNDEKNSKRRSLPPVPQGDRATSTSSVTRSASEDTKNVRPRIVPKVAPKPAPKPPPTGRDVAGPPAQARGNAGDDPDYVSFKEIPSSLKGLTVKQVADCLRILNMEQYIQKFEDEDIDGELLAELEEADLKEFGFNNFHMKKMKKFQNGWRPKKE